MKNFPLLLDGVAFLVYQGLAPRRQEEAERSSQVDEDVIQHDGDEGLPGVCGALVEGR